MVFNHVHLLLCLIMFYLKIMFYCFFFNVFFLPLVLCLCCLYVVCWPYALFLELMVK